MGKASGLLSLVSCTSHHWLLLLFHCIRPSDVFAAAFRRLGHLHPVFSSVHCPLFNPRPINHCRKTRYMLYTF
ncbi:hypothetical protein EDC04DRAFT_2650636 [Pisolithus marmoratus]|nr:hypothetical protein EDC04DRAFT_2650636 [Pisolithus marmoratus]